MSKNKANKVAVPSAADQEIALQMAANKIANAEQEKARSGSVAEREAILQRQQEIKAEKAEQLAEIAKAQTENAEAAREQEEKMAANRERAKKKLEKDLEKAAKVAGKEEVEISVRKAEAAARRAPVFETREKNRAGLHPRMLTGKAMAIEMECNRQLQEYNMIINSPDGLLPKDAADVLA